MTTRARRGSFPRTRAPKRKTFWESTNLGATVAINTTLSIELMSDSLGEFEVGMTLVRTILEFNFFQTLVDVATQVGLGLIMVNREQVDAAISSEPSEEGDRESWLWRTIQTYRRTAGGQQIDRFSIDLKSRRVFRFRDAEMRLLVQNTTSNSGQTFEVTGMARQLFMKP